MSRLPKPFLIAMLLILCVAGSALGWLSHRAYFRFAGSIADVLQGIPATEREPSHVFKRAVDRVHPEGVLPIVVMRLVSDLVGPERSVVRTLREAIWQQLLPLQLSEEQILSLYAHFLPLEDGTGLEYGARLYFAKPPDALTYRECLTLVVVAQSPRAYSPSRHPERLQEALLRYGE